jgi:hypothetical protein
MTRLPQTTRLITVNARREIELFQCFVDLDDPFC